MLPTALCILKELEVQSSPRSISHLIRAELVPSGPPSQNQHWGDVGRINEPKLQKLVFHIHIT